MHVRYDRYYGGWVAPNIYFLGMSGVVNFGGLRIGGLSGIWKKFDYKQGARLCSASPHTCPVVVSGFF